MRILTPPQHDSGTSTMDNRRTTLCQASRPEQRPCRQMTSPSPSSTPSSGQASTSPPTDATSPSTSSQRNEPACPHRERARRLSSRMPLYDSISLVAQAGGPVYYFQRRASDSQNAESAAFSHFYLLKQNGDRPDKLVISAEQPWGEQESPGIVGTLLHDRKRPRKTALPTKGLLAYSPSGQGNQVAYDRITHRKDVGDHLSRLVPRRSHRFALHSRDSCYYEVLRTEGYSEILRRLSAYLLAHGKVPSLVCKCVVLVHEAERYGKNYVDVFWPTDEVVILSLTSRPTLSLTMEAYTNNNSGSAADVAPHIVTIRTWVPKGADIDLLTKTMVVSMMPSVQVIEVSRTKVFLPNLNASKWTGHIKILVSVSVPSTPHNAPMDSAQLAAEYLPGYVHFMGKAINLRYEHRRPWCSFCKSNATSFHLRQDCTRAGHSKRKVVDRKDLMTIEAAV